MTCFVRRVRSDDWSKVGWHYKALYAAAPAHNRLLLRARGLENVPATGGYLLAGNHTSWWDPVILRAITPRPVFQLAKKELLSNRFNKWFFFDKGGCIPVDRNSKNPEALAAATDALRAGRIIGIFPEATRYVGNLGPAKTGVARLAIESGAPVVPLAILTDRFWPPGQKLPKLTQRVYVNVGAPLHIEGAPGEAEAARRGTDQVMAAIAKLLSEAREARDRKDAWAVP